MSMKRVTSNCCKALLLGFGYLVISFRRMKKPYLYRRNVQCNAHRIAAKMEEVVLMAPILSLAIAPRVGKGNSVRLISMIVRITPVKIMGFA